jgi:hypothetical protein
MFQIVKELIAGAVGAFGRHDMLFEKVATNVTKFRPLAEMYICLSLMSSLVLQIFVLLSI